MMDAIQKNSRILLICLLLILATLVTFWQVKDHEFINYDDGEYVYENPQVQAGLTFQGFKWAFTTFQAGNWHPLTWLSHMLDCQLFGLKPAGHHGMNLFFHIASTLLLFLVLHRMTKALYQSAFVAALFALHPLHVESVAWVAERKDVLSAFFWMLTMGAYAHYGERPDVRRYLLVLLFFVLGLMAKPMLVTLPFILLLMDYWPLGRWQPAKPAAADAIPSSPAKNPRRKKRKDATNYTSPQARAQAQRRMEITPTHPSSIDREGGHFQIKDTAQNTKAVIPYQWSVIRFLVWEKVPLFIFTAISCIITFYAQKKGGAVSPLDLLPLGARMGNALLSYVGYIGKMIWPQNLAFFYPYPFVQPLWQVFGAALILVLITIMVIGRAKRSPYLAVGWFWFMGALAPVIGLVQVGRQAMADRYTYIPLVGLFVMIAWGAPELLKKWRYQKAALAASAVVILLTLTMVTYMQLPYWRDSITLFRHALSVTADNELVRNNLGNAFFLRGELKEAEFHLREALRINPRVAEAHYNLGNVLSSQSKTDEAIVHLREALRIKSDYVEARNNLGMALRNKGNIEEAVSHFREVLRISPHDRDAHNNIGTAFFTQGRIQEAEFHLREALRINPREAKVHYNMGIVLSSQGKIDEAISHLREAISLKPDYIEAHYNLANSLASKGMFSEAVTHFAEVIRLNPNDEKAHNNMGLALLIEGKIDEAVAHFREALRINPDLTLAQENLKDALRLQGKKSEQGETGREG